MDQLSESQGIESLKPVLKEAAARHVSGHEGMLETAVKLEHSEMRREIIGTIFDQLHEDYEVYKRLAREFISEDDFPERFDRWPEFFLADQSTGTH